MAYKYDCGYINFTVGELGRDFKICIGKHKIISVMCSQVFFILVSIFYMLKMLLNARRI